MLRIEIVSDQVAVRKGTGANGKPWQMREQTGWAQLVDRDSGLPDPHPTKVTIMLEGERAPYKPGAYTLDPRSYFVGQWGKLTVGAVVLAPDIQAARKSA